MSDYFVSPKHLASSVRPGNLDDAIDVFEAAVNGWCLDHARALTRPRYAARQHAGFAILFLVSSYFEGIEPCFVGAKTGKAHEVWRAGFRRVFPEFANVPDGALDAVYGETRCGLYHDLSGGLHIQLAREGPAFSFDVDSSGSLLAAQLNPWEILKRVEQHFRAYIGTLRDPANKVERNRFVRYRGLSRTPVTHFVAPARSNWP